MKLKFSLILMLLLAGSLAPVHAADVVRQHSFAAAQVHSLHISNSVGQVTVRPVDEPNIRVELAITGKRSGLLRRKKDVSEMDLTVREQGNRLLLAFKENNAEAEWVIYMPAISDLHVELGVGSSDVELADSALRLEVGVGSAQVTAPATSVGSVRAEVGVGGITITGLSDYRSSRRVVAEEASGRGQGSNEIRVEVGVGDVSFRAK